MYSQTSKEKRNKNNYYVDNNGRCGGLRLSPGWGNILCPRKDTLLWLVVPLFSKELMLGVTLQWSGILSGEE